MRSREIHIKSCPCGTGTKERVAFIMSVMRLSSKARLGAKVIYLKLSYNPGGKLPSSKARGSLSFVMGEELL